MASRMIYLAKRRPGTTHDEFLENWKSHSALTARFPAIRKHIVQVAQCSRLLQDEIIPEASRDYDGVNLLTMRSLLDSLEIWDDPDARISMRNDELRVFSTYVKDFTLFAEDTVLIDAPMRQFVVVQFLRRRPDVDRESFIKGWTGGQARALMTLPAFNTAVRRFVHSHRLLDAPTGYEYDGIAELWFDELNQIKHLFADPDFRQNFFTNAASFSDIDGGVLLLARVNLARPPIEG